MAPDEVVKELKEMPKNNIFDDVEKEVIQSAISLISDYQKLLDREKKWQDMCNEHVGCSMLADEFAGEPHEPEEFGGYVDNLEHQAEDYQKLRERVSVEKLAKVIKKFERNFIPKQVFDHENKLAQSIITYLQQPTEHIER